MFCHYCYRLPTVNSRGRVMMWHVFFSICTVAVAWIRVSACPCQKEEVRRVQRAASNLTAGLSTEHVAVWRPGIWHQLLTNAPTWSGVSSWVTVYETPGSDTSLSPWHGSGYREARQACDARGMGIKVVSWGMLRSPANDTRWTIKLLSDILLY